MNRCRVCCSSKDVIQYDPRLVWAYPWRTTVCPAHCEDHDYEHERSERWWFCKHCGDPADVNWVCERANP